MTEALLIGFAILGLVTAAFSVASFVYVKRLKANPAETVRPLSDQIANEFRLLRQEHSSSSSSSRMEITQLVTSLGDSLRDQIKVATEAQNDRLAGLVAQSENASIALRDGMRNSLNDVKTDLSHSSTSVSKSIESALQNIREAIDLRLASSSRQQDTQLEVFGSKLVSLNQTVSETMQSSQKIISENLLAFRSDLNSRVSEQNKQMSDFTKAISALSENANRKSDELRISIENRLSALSNANELKLEQMRVTVDEKLHSTLERRLGESFKLVSDRLDTVHKGLGEMQTLANGVGDLKKVLTNIKSRGTWGEIQLGALLEEILVSEQYDRNVKIRPRSSEAVEFAVRLPGPEDRPVFLPIDSKFPKEDFERLQAAQENADIDAIKAATTKLENELKRCARDIRDKYIHPPYSTDFAVLFLPVESLYAEVLRLPDVISFLQRECRVVIAGPTTLAALLNSLQMGFKTLAIQKSSSEVWKVLGGVKSEFGTFAGILEKVSRQMGTVQNSIEDAANRTRIIEKKLLKVEAIAPAEKSSEITLVLSDTAQLPEPETKAEGE